LGDEGIEFVLHGWGHGFVCFFGLCFFVEIGVVVFPASGIRFGNTNLVSDGEDGEGGECAEGDDDDGFHGSVLVWFGYGESLGALNASVNAILELSFQKTGDFLSFHENAGGFVSIGENNQRTSRSAESVNGEKRGFIGLEVARLADGVACHGGERLTAAGGPCKNSFAFSAKKKTAHFLLYA
jgi:hypothetical protein